MNSIIYAVQIVDKLKIGLHARPVAKIVAKISGPQFKDTKVEVAKLADNINLKTQVQLTGEEQKANAKSVLSFIGLQIKHNTKIAFIISGDEVDDAKNAIKDILLEENLIIK